MKWGTRRNEEVPSKCDAVVLEGLDTWDTVVELIEGAWVDVVEGTVVGVVEGTVVDVVVGTVVGVVDVTLAPAPAQPATINPVTTEPTRERAGYQRCSFTGTHGSEWNHAKWSKLGMMAS